ncbi:MAG: glycogen debranching protein GlgX [Elusimicrobia bacterium]|nr:glycogen debranching protein GlgX [Elusimicrobiota bacterium]
MDNPPGVSEGRAYPLGASLDGDGVNFAVFSRHAEALELLLFDRADDDPARVIALPARTRSIWHGRVAGLKAGQLYGFRARGPFRPEHGLRFNPAKLLLDPYAKALSHKFVNTNNLLLAYDAGSPARDLSLDPRDSCRVAPKGVVVDDAFEWKGDRRPNLRLEEVIVYEVHLKGFTAHPSSKVRHPGTYLGFIEKIPHLKRLGVNAVELLPVHEFMVDDFLRERGLTNYWGYNTAAFFAPEQSFAAGSVPGAAVGEFKTLVRELHKAGIELILDVVYNHTAEGSELGPTLSLRGLDNPSYYQLCGPEGSGGRHYMNHTGCGNSLDMGRPAALRLVMDSLRYWATTMRVDGFRFDLASVLGREGGHYSTSTSFFDAVSQDPVLSRLKLIAEPWDLGTYQVGNFPEDWSEWNGRFRDCLRKFAKGDPGQRPELGRRLSGSADLYGDDGRHAYNSVNFITCHDGFTLRDLVSYDGKHNEANGEGNRDGSDDNLSWNCGAEGEASDAAVEALRGRIARNHICHLFFSCGTPMLLGGDELLRTQRGNNNAYCQDNALSWHDWTLAERNSDFLEFTRKAIALTRRFPVLQRRRFRTGEDLDRDQVADLQWMDPDGGPVAWDDPEGRGLAWLLDGHGPDAQGRDYRLMFVSNADHRLRAQTLPPAGAGRRWRRIIDTSLPAGPDFAEAGGEVPVEPAGSYLVNPRSVVVLAAS